MTHPPPTIINIFDATKEANDVQTIELAKEFDLGHISIQYVSLPHQKTFDIPVAPKTNLLCYVIVGEGSLSLGNQDSKIKQDDCFSFAASDFEQNLSLTLTSLSEKLGILVTSDVVPQQDFVSATPEFPVIVSAREICKWRNNGIDATKDIKLTTVTDMNKVATRPWGFVREHTAPGSQSSNAHCHSEEDEFAIILEGKSRYWYQGITPEPILRPGDCVGWKAGTGICHTLLNDAEDETGKGENLVFLVWGENKGKADKLYYATTKPYWWNDSNRWFERPDLPQGPASGLPKYPRSDDSPYPS